MSNYDERIMPDYPDINNNMEPEREITADWLSEISFLSALTSSPQKKRAAFIVKQPDLTDNDYKSWLWLLEDNKARCLTQIYKESSFAFLDEETLLFPDRRSAISAKPKKSDRDIDREIDSVMKSKKSDNEIDSGMDKGRNKNSSADEETDKREEKEKGKGKGKDYNNENRTQFYRLNIAGNEIEPAFELPFRCKEFLPIGNSRYLLLSEIDIENPDLWRESCEKVQCARAGEDQDYMNEGNSKDDDKADDAIDVASAESGHKENDNTETTIDEDWFMELDEIPFRKDNSGYCQGKRTRLFLYDERSQEISVLTAPDLDVRDLMLTPQRSGVLFRVNDRSADYRWKANLCDDIYELDLETLDLTRLYGHKDLNIGKAFYWQDQVFVLAADMNKFGLNQNYRLYQIHQGERLERGSEEILFGNSIVSDVRLGTLNNFLVRDDEVYYLSILEGEGVLRRINPSGKSELIFSGPGSIDSFTFVADTIYVIGLFADRPQEIYQLKQDTSAQEGGEARTSAQEGGEEHTAVREAQEVRAVASDGREARTAAPKGGEEHSAAQEAREVRNSSELLRVTHFNDTALSGIKLSTPISLQIESNGDRIDGWVMLPENFDLLGSYPGILCIHGGPKMAYGTSFSHEMQFLAGEGYIVFYCNPHGSDGRNDNFSDIRGKYGTIDFQDLMNFTDAVLEKYPQLDETRMGVSGGSYGGFMTNWIISHTDRFSAAIIQRSISNWLSFYGTADIGYYFAEDQIAADFFNLDGAEKLWKHSPLCYADQIETPVLIIHSAKDYRCPAEQGYQLFTALKVRGVDCKMIVFKDESHELSRSGKPRARSKRLKQIVHWFNSYLRC